MIGQNPEGRKEARQGLDFVQNHASAQVGESAQWVVLQPGTVQVVLEVEPVDIGTPFVMAGERGFPALAGSQEEDDGRLPKPFLDAAQQLGSFVAHDYAD